MEVILPTSPNGTDQFDFNGLRVSPYLSAPSSPKRFGDFSYLSAPTSPSNFYTHFDYFYPSPSNNDDDDAGFAFFVTTTDSEIPSRSAEELFDGGKIKLLKQDDGLLESARSPLLLSPTRPRTSPLKKAIIGAFSSPRNKNKNKKEDSRGRDTTPTSQISSSARRRVSRSHPPYRISRWEEEELNSHQHQQQNNNNKEEECSSLSNSSSKSTRKWRLRDFLLFRSASEGRGTTKDPFRKYPLLYKKAAADGGKAASPLRSSENPKLRRKETTVSPHELHYTRKKAESEDLKKRTFLPYKQGILGRLAGLGSLNR